jgi:hypothetical protein
MAGVAREVRRDTTVELPARIVTGGDGALGIRQSGTQVSIGSNSDVEIPEAAEDGQLVARLVQHRGNVHYDVETRPVRKLRVETPFLVAVVKGTQFTVVVQNDTTTISLFEGLLEVRTPDGSDVIELNAGEIAIRSSADATIRVLGMDDDTVPAPQANAGIVAVGNSGTAGNLLGNAPRLGGDLAVGLGDVTVAIGTQITTGAEPSAGLGVDLGLDEGLGAGGLEATVDLGAGAAGAALDPRLDLGAGSADLGLDAGADLGAASADIGLDAGVDLGAGTVDLGLDTGIDLGGASADLGLDAGVDLGAGSVDVGLDTGVDLGGASADLGLDTGVDLGGGSVDVGLDTGLDVGGTEIDLGVDLSLEDGIDLDIGLSGGDSDTDGGRGGLLGRIL